MLKPRHNALVQQIFERNCPHVLSFEAGFAAEWLAPASNTVVQVRRFLETAVGAHEGSAAESTYIA